MLSQPTSFNDKLVVENYVPTAIKSEIKHGFATASQKNALKGLKVLFMATLSNGETIQAGSTAYIKEETLHNRLGKTKLTCDTVKGDFIVVTMGDVEFITPPIEGQLA